MPDTDLTRDYNRLEFLTPDRDMNQQFFADLSRVCEVEDSVVEWFDKEYVMTKALATHIRRSPDL